MMSGISSLLWLILTGVVILFAIFGLILTYHWHQFGMRKLAVGTAELVFFSGALIFILGAVVSVALF